MPGRPTLRAHDLAPPRQAARERRLQLRVRARRRQARAADQLATTTTSARGRSTSSRRRWSRPPRRTTSRSRSRKSPPARSSTSTGRSREPHGAHPARRQRGDRRLQGAGAGAAGHEGRPRRARRSRRRRRSVRRRRLVRRADRRARCSIDEFERDPARGAFPGEPPPEHDPISHLELVRNADAYLVAPASANTIAKLAHGLADNLLTSAALAATCPVVVAPAMNNHMWEHPATRANLETLRARGVDRASSPAPASSPPRASAARGASPSPPSCSPRSRRVAAGRRRRAAAARRPAAARHRRRHARADRRACATSATARRAGWASRWPRSPPTSAPTSR